MKIKFFLFFLFINNFLYAQQNIDTLILRKHINTLVDSFGFRSYRHTENLDKIADYIATELGKYTDTVYRQYYTVGGRRFQNVVAKMGNPKSKHIVVGAHYDACGDLPAADDNASGVAGMLELARVLRGVQTDYCYNFVAFSTEEPPYFFTQNMGSFVYAKELYLSKTPVEGMISLEMLGYFSSKPHSQTYPLGIMWWFYGNKGDFITLAANTKKGHFVRKFTRRYKATKSIRTHKFYAPRWLPITDRSDQRCFWQFGYSALMITDTAMWRNFAYHTENDTIDRLDFTSMKKVLEGVAKVLSAY